MPPQPFEVDVTHEAASLLGPILIAVGAVIASGLTAGLTVTAANRRQKTQLEEDRAQHEARLEHDRVLREAQLTHDRTALIQGLEHDRGMQHREAAQRFLDDVVDRERALRYLIVSYRTLLERAEKERRDRENSDSDTSELQQLIEKLASEILNKEIEVTEALNQGVSDSILLSIRMGRSAAPVKAHREVVETLNAWMKTMETGQGEWRQRTPDEKDLEKEAEAKVRGKQSAFLLACAQWYDPTPSARPDQPMPAGQVEDQSEDANANPEDRPRRYDSGMDAPLAPEQGIDAPENARELAIQRLKMKQDFKGIAAAGLFAVIVVVVIWAIGGGGYFWPVWVMLGAAIGIVTQGWKAYGPSNRITEADVQWEMTRGS